MSETIKQKQVETQDMTDSLSKANEVLAITGVDILDASLTPERVIKLAEAIAQETDTMGFTLDGDDETTKELADKLMQDYADFTDSVGYYGYDKAKELGLLPPDYNQRRSAKILLIKSSARDLARRAGLDDSVLDTKALGAVRGKTGIDFMQLHQGYPILQPEVRPRNQRKSEKKSDYAGPVGTVIDVSGVGAVPIVQYSQHGKPMMRDPRTGQVVSTFGRM